MYDEAVMSVRCGGDNTREFPLNIGSHQGAISRPCLFGLVISLSLFAFHLTLNIKDIL